MAGRISMTETVDQACRLASARKVIFAHCDPRVLHAPLECPYCDETPERQIERILCGVAFSGQTPAAGQIACPADRAVASGERGEYKQWPGNTPEGYPI